MYCTCVCVGFLYEAVRLHLPSSKSFISGWQSHYHRQLLWLRKRHQKHQCWRKHLVKLSCRHLLSLHRDVLILAFWQCFSRKPCSAYIDWKQWRCHCHAYSFQIQILGIPIAFPVENVSFDRDKGLNKLAQIRGMKNVFQENQHFVLFMSGDKRPSGSKDTVLLLTSNIFHCCPVVCPPCALLGQTSWEQLCKSEACQTYKIETQFKCRVKTDLNKPPVCPGDVFSSIGFMSLQSLVFILFLGL